VQAKSLVFPFLAGPKPLELVEAAPGIFWLRLPLPFRLNHVNVYLIEDGDGYVLLDTGLDTAATRALWQGVFDGPLKGKRLTAVLATHWHPDHIGLGGHLAERHGVKLYASQSEYLDSLCMRLDPDLLNSAPFRSFFRSHGLDGAHTDILLQRGLNYLSLVSKLPRTYRRVIAGETLEIGGRKFDVLTGGGHSPEQIMLYCASENVFLCADQVMAKITPNISVDAVDPEGDPLGIYLRSLNDLRRRIPEDALLLPGHNLPFVGLQTRIDELVAHHEARCELILQACRSAPHSAADMVPLLFGRDIEDPHQLSFAFSESLAHANYLIRRGALDAIETEQGVTMRAA
jgi:glyoxylase-like metal-dependent hydrolase (beta-lactamase superfamily II)